MEHVPLIADLFSSLVLGGIVVFIAYQQWRTARANQSTNERRFRLEVYDRRLAVYKLLRRLFGQIVRDGRASLEMLSELSDPLSEATFLFDGAMRDYLEALWKRIVDMAMLQNQLYGDAALPVGEERSNVAHRHAEMLMEITTEPERLRQMFQPFLALSDPS